MRKLLIAALLLAPAAGHAGNVYTRGFNNFAAPTSCGNSGQFLQTDGSCNTTWATSSPSALLASTNTWSAQQTFAQSTTENTDLTLGTASTSPHLYFTASGYNANAISLSLENGGATFDVGGNGVNEMWFRSDTWHLRFGSGADAGIQRVGAAAMKITDGTSGGGTLLFGLPPKTAAQIRASTPQTAWIMNACTDCATVAVCISTGTAAGAWSLITNKGSACN